MTSSILSISNQLFRILKNFWQKIYKWTEPGGLPEDLSQGPRLAFSMIEGVPEQYRLKILMHNNKNLIHFSTTGNCRGSD